MATAPAGWNDAVDEAPGEPICNDGWITIDVDSIELRHVRKAGAKLVTVPQGAHQDVKNDKCKYGVVLACGRFKGREARQDALSPEMEKHWPLAVGTLVEHICMCPYEAGATQGLIRTEHVVRFWPPQAIWPSWVIRKESPNG